MKNLDAKNFTLPPLVAGKNPEETTVVVAMSGGVDSSVAAAVCAQAGYKTIGVTLKLWDYAPTDAAQASAGGGTCCSSKDVDDAREVCAKMGVEHHVLQLQSDFKNKVINDFVSTYISGATPIPCVRCNERIKFGALMAKAKELGADVLITGHYVRKGTAPDGSQAILRGFDLAKDQSYYLFALKRDQIDFINFPLGHLNKDQTRQLAKDLGLHVHEKSESQDICFVPQGDYREVVKAYAPEEIRPGKIVTVDGEIAGEHQGLIGYTVGQRKGLGGGFGKPMYVVALNAKENQVIIGPKESLGQTVFIVKDVNWTAPEMLDGAEVLVKVRSLHEGIIGTLKDLGAGRVEVTLRVPEEHVAPGQAAVFYGDDSYARMFGGGWIEVPEKFRREIQVKIV